jgi:hypothetical protein
MQKYFSVQRSLHPLTSPSCSPQAQQKHVLCSLPACPPEVQLQFKLKRELFCIPNLTSVASTLNTNTLLKEKRAGRCWSSEAKRSGYYSSCTELLWTQTIPLRDQCIHMQQTGSSLYPQEPDSPRLCSNSLPILWQGRREGGKIYWAPRLCPAALF